jgi:hypothetical protein
MASEGPLAAAQTAAPNRPIPNGCANGRFTLPLFEHAILDDTRNGCVRFYTS